MSGDPLDLDAIERDYSLPMYRNNVPSATALALVAEVRALRRWKNEALPVMDGLQDLGGALGLPLGSRITGRDAADAALALRAQVERIEALADDMVWKRPEQCPCETPESCCGSVDSCDAMQPSVKVVGLETIRAALKGSTP